MVQPVLIEVALGADEEVAKGATEMLSELKNIENFNLERKLIVLGKIVVNVLRTAISTQPRRKVRGVPQQQVRRKR